MKKTQIYMILGLIVLLGGLFAIVWMQNNNANHEQSKDNPKSKPPKGQQITQKDETQKPISPADFGLIDYNSGTMIDILDTMKKKFSNPDANPDLFMQQMDEMYIGGQGPLGKFYKSLKAVSQDNIMQEKQLDDIRDFLDKNDIQADRHEIEVQIITQDVDGNPISGANVYLWGYSIGETGQDGMLAKTLTVPNILATWNIQARKKGYTPGFVQLPNLYKHVYLSTTLTMRQHGHVFTQNAQDIDISIDDDFKFELSGECNFKTAQGECYDGQVDIDVSYIPDMSTAGQTPDRNVAGEVEVMSGQFATIYEPNISIGNMFAVDPDTELWTMLNSAGMAFINVYDDEGNLLRYTQNNKAKVCYYYNEEWAEMLKREFEKKMKESGQEIDEDKEFWRYWRFDKTDLLRYYDEKALKTYEGDFVCYFTDHVY